MRDTHDEIDAGAHIVRGETSHEGVEFRGCRTDAEEERDFDEYDEERTRAGEVRWEYEKGADTYRQRAPKRIMMETWKRWEIPRAKQRNMHITPVLQEKHNQ